MTLKEILKYIADDEYIRVDNVCRGIYYSGLKRDCKSGWLLERNIVCFSIDIENEQLEILVN